MSIGEGSHGRNQFEFNYKNARRKQWEVDMGVGAVAVMVGWQRTHLPPASYPVVVVAMFRIHLDVTHTCPYIMYLTER